jgi:hypothetical protein
MMTWIDSSFARAVRTVLAALAVMLFALPASAGETEVKKDEFKYGGIRYFRGKAENVRLGSYGEKKTPVGQANYLAVEKNIKNEHFEGSIVKTAGPVSIDWDKVSEAELEAGGSVKYIKAGGKATLTRKAAKSAKLKLVKFFVNAGALKGVLNKEADGARNYLAKEGRDGRVAGEVWVVMEAELAEKVTTGGSLNAKASDGGLAVSVGGSGSSTTTTTITIAADTTFAYLLFKPKFDKDKKKIEDLEDDQSGFY